MQLTFLEGGTNLTVNKISNTLWSMDNKKKAGAAEEKRREVEEKEDAIDDDDVSYSSEGDDGEYGSGGSGGLGEDDEDGEAYVDGNGRKRKRLTRKWSPEEDMMLARLVTIHGQRDWGLIARNMPGKFRKGKQCRERWRNQLDPNIKREPWTPEEEATLQQAHATFGNK